MRSPRSAELAKTLILIEIHISACTGSGHFSRCRQIGEWRRGETAAASGARNILYFQDYARPFGGADAPGRRGAQIPFSNGYKFSGIFSEFK